ncbi:MAG: PEP-CTERM sorting domain-containing protein [Nostoc sp.]
MKTYHVLQATLTLATCTLSALVISTSANASTVVTFDDLKGDNLLVPDGYGGIRWDNNWTYYGFDQFPYTPESIPNRIYGKYDKWNHSIPFYFESPVIFDGSYFAGSNPFGVVSFSLYNGGTLQAISASLAPSSTPTFLSSGYTGLVDEVRVNFYSSSIVMDNVTYHTAAVPEPASLIGLLGLGAFGITSKFKRKQKQQVHS